MATTGEIVFISYSREDEEYARRLSEDLARFGAITWLDKDQILAGHNWEVKIRQAIDQSRYFIPLLSSRSVGKIGYVQDEFSYAIKNYDKVPASKIGIIPVRIDDCEMPYELKTIHYADLFPDWARGVSEILKSMGISEKRNENQDNNEQQIIGLPEKDWKKLLNSISLKKCIPFIGNGIWLLEGGKALFPSIRSILERWKKDHGSLLEDLYHSARVSSLDESYQVARLAQFLEMDVQKDNPREMLSDMLSELDRFELESQFRTGSPFSILANLDLPIYMTTNYDKFLEIVLERHHKKPKTELCTWKDNLMRAVEYGQIPSVFRNEEFKLSQETPVVYHILGHVDQPQSMVLTEKDYFEYVVNLNKNKEKDTIPAKVRNGFGGRATLLFIGYSLEDINFRAIFQGFLSFQEVRDNLSIAVQIPPVISREKQLEIQGFLNRYTENMYHVSVYWGKTSDFMIELNNRWGAYKNRSDLTSG